MRASWSAEVFARSKYRTYCIAAQVCVQTSRPLEDHFKKPFEYAILPQVESKPREIWTAEIIRSAMDNCRDAKLYIAINLAFACSLRMGEILGLTWDNVHIEDKNIAADIAYI